MLFQKTWPLVQNVIAFLFHFNCLVGANEAENFILDYFTFLVPCFLNYWFS